MFQIAISAIRGVSYRGDIAIDNIKVLPNQCGKFSSQTPFISFHHSHCRFNFLSMVIHSVLIEWFTGRHAKIELDDS